MALVLVSLALPARSRGLGSPGGWSGPEPQEEGVAASPRVVLEARVTSRGSGNRVGVDRGTSDGVRVGDPVIFHPRGGRRTRGQVAKVFERWCSVEVPSESLVPEAGTAAEVRVPRRRLERLGLLGPSPAASAPATPEPDAPEARVDEGWTPDQPLLGPMRVPSPAQRRTRSSGRLHAAVRYIGTDQAGRSDAVLRSGLRWIVENPFQRGGVFQFEGEVDHRDGQTPSGPDVGETYLRLDRLSYRMGDDRFAPRSLEVGRFLQRGMPEFGELDGVEWGTRLEGGDRVAVSLGAMPEPDGEHDTGDDLQVGVSYRWVANEEERLSIAAGFQKTLHHGDSDRDLVVARLHYLPVHGWGYDVAAWIDYYGGSERAKGPGLELTQLVAAASRVWEGGLELDVTLTHFAFPDLERDESLFLAADALSELRVDRLAVDGRRPLAEGRTLLGRVSVWDDEDESGGDLEGGLRLEDALFEGSDLDTRLFGTAGDFSTVFGARSLLAQELEDGRWSLTYEITHHTDDGGGGREAILQHRLRADREFLIGEHWYLSVAGEGLVWDDAASWSVGLYLQRSF